MILLLERAETKRDVKAILDRFGPAIFRRAWDLLDPLDRASLLMIRAFDGTIIREVDLDDISQ